MAAGLRTIRVRLLGDSKGLDRTARNGQKQLGRWQGAFKKFGRVAKLGLAAAGVGLAAAGAAAVKFGGDAVKAASDLNETVNKSNVIFGSNARAMQKWAAGAAKNMGLSKQAALESAASFGDMFQQIGFAGDQSAKMSRSVVQLSADLGSFNNLPTADVSERVAAAFRGEFDSLQALIPNINAARVQKVALAQSGKDNADALTAQEKAQAVLSIVQKDGARAQGDFARTSGSLANQQKILAAQFENVKARLGTALLPVVTRFANFLTEKVAPAVDRFITQMQTGKGAGGEFAGAMRSMWEATKEAFGNISAAIRTMFGDLEILRDDSETASTDVAGSFQELAAQISASMIFASEQFKQLTSGFRNAAIQIGLSVDVIRSTLRGDFDRAWRKSKELHAFQTREIKDNTARSFDQVLEDVRSNMRKAQNNMAVRGKNITDGWAGSLGGMRRTTRTDMSGVLTSMDITMGDVQSTTDRGGRGARSSFTGEMGRMRRQSGREVGRIPGTLNRSLGDTDRMLHNSGTEITNGLLDGIERAMRGIKGWLRRNVWNPIVNAVRELFGIDSPSTVFMSFGRMMILGLIKGMIRTNPARLVRKALGGVTNVLGNVLGTLFPGGGGNASANMQLGRAMAAAMGWAGGQWTALRALWQGESGWDHLARNPTSGAYGIPQSLPAGKMASAGADWRTNPATQIRWGLNYIAQRYGSPAGAYAAWLSRSPHWYDAGGVATGRGFIAKATSEPERVLSPRQTEAFERLVTLLDRGGGRGLNVENLHVAAFSDRFSLSQIRDELALQGAV